MAKKRCRSYLLQLLKSREIKNLRREKRKSKRKVLRKFKSKNDFLRFLNRSSFLPNKKIKVTPEKMLSIKIPSHFSLISNPEATIELYRKIYKAFKMPEIKGLVVD